MNICWYHFSSIDSTNSWPKNNQARLARDCLNVITAKEQSKGRGRWGRTWISPAGKNCLLSFAFFWPKEILNPFYFSQAATLSVEELLQREGISCQIKWPNDILVQGKKIAGILTEIEETLIIIGIGLNVNMDESEMAALPKKATSLFVETGTLFEVETIQNTLASLFAKRLALASENGFGETCAAWHQKVQWMVGTTACVQTAKGQQTGVITELCQSGSLILTAATGTQVSICSGEIFSY